MTINRTYYTSPGAVPNDIPEECWCDQAEGQLGNTLASTYCCFEKGYTPPPFKIEHMDGFLRITFEQTEFTSTCNCAIECISEAYGYDDSSNSVGYFCPADENLTVDIQTTTSGESSLQHLTFTFLDVNGNESELEITSVVAAKPQSVMGLVEEIDSGRRARIMIAPRAYTINYEDLKDYAIQYQIQRYINNPETRETWVDWTDLHTTNRSHILAVHKGVHYDADVRRGVDYGYRVRFRASTDNVTLWSDWRVFVA